MLTYQLDTLLLLRRNHMGCLGGALQVIVTVDIETDGTVEQAEINGIGAPNCQNGCN